MRHGSPRPGDVRAGRQGRSSGIADRGRPGPRPQGEGSRAIPDKPPGGTREAQGGSHAPLPWPAPTLGADPVPGNHDRPDSHPQPPEEGAPGRRPGDPLLKPDHGNHVHDAARPPQPLDVTKADGSIEPFDRSKLERSLRSAGADEATASEVALRVEGQLKVAGIRATTREVRSLVMEQLARRDPDSADRYDGTRKLVVRPAVEATTGVARLPPGVVASMRLRNGGTLRMVVRGHWRNLGVEVNERTAILGDEVRLNVADMRALGVRSGDRVLVTRLSRDSGVMGAS